MRLVNRKSFESTTLIGSRASAGGVQSLLPYVLINTFLIAVLMSLFNSMLESTGYGVPDSYLALTWILFIVLLVLELSVVPDTIDSFYNPDRNSSVLPGPAGSRRSTPAMAAPRRVTPAPAMTTINPAYQPSAATQPFNAWANE